MSEFAWLIEAPGARYLGTRKIGHYPEFFWTTNPAKATRFFSGEQADGVMMAVRRMEPSLFAFAVNLGDAWPREHKWLQSPGDTGKEGVGDVLCQSAASACGLTAGDALRKSEGGEP